jgi:two-component system, OmpR family, alkaline phosphatase synthesis response regulator PhoP
VREDRVSGNILSMSKKKILIVEDDKDISRLVRYNLEKAGYECFQAFDGDEAFELLGDFIPDLIILDVMLPGQDGFDVCRSIKKNDRLRNISVLFLTAKGEEIDRVVGLELGADDYVVKPFSPRELGLRVKAILRRGGEKESVKETFCIGGLKVYLAKIQVSINDRSVDLAAKEFELLTTLIKAKGRVLSREQLLETIWGYDESFDIQTRTVDVHIRTLRKKLKSEAARIVTAKGYGYRFNTQE